MLMEKSSQSQPEADTVIFCGQTRLMDGPSGTNGGMGSCGGTQVDAAES